MSQDKTSLEITGGGGYTTTVSDSQKTHAKTVLLTGLSVGDLIEVLRTENGSLTTTVVPGLPKNTYFYPVTSADISSEPLKYNPGSLGSVKFIITFPKTAVVGDQVWETSFEYHFTSEPKFVSHIKERSIELTIQIFNEFQ